MLPAFVALSFDYFISFSVCLMLHTCRRTTTTTTTTRTAITANISKRIKCSIHSFWSFCVVWSYLWQIM